MKTPTEREVFELAARYWYEIRLCDRVQQAVGDLALNCDITKRGSIRVDTGSVENARKVLAVLSPKRYKRCRSHQSVYVYGEHQVHRDKPDTGEYTSSMGHSEGDWPPKPGDTVWLDGNEQVTVVQFHSEWGWITYKYGTGEEGVCGPDYYKTRSQREDAIELNREDPIDGHWRDIVTE